MTQYFEIYTKPKKMLIKIRNIEYLKRYIFIYLASYSINGHHFTYRTQGDWLSIYHDIYMINMHIQIYTVNLITPLQCRCEIHYSNIYHCSSKMSAMGRDKMASICGYFEIFFFQRKWHILFKYHQSLFSWNKLIFRKSIYPRCTMKTDFN